MWVCACVGGSQKKDAVFFFSFFFSPRPSLPPSLGPPFSPLVLGNGDAAGGFFPPLSPLRTYVFLLSFLRSFRLLGRRPSLLPGGPSEASPSRTPTSFDGLYFFPPVLFSQLGPLLPLL